MIEFECKRGARNRHIKWKGSLAVKKPGNPCEAILNARGSNFYLIVGRYENGNYLCIPNWSIGTDLADLSDSFWNFEHIREYTKLGVIDTCSVVTALTYLESYM